MSKYIFKSTVTDLDDRVVTEVTTVAHGDLTWAELFDEFANFLRGCGFVLPQGSPDFWDEES